MSDAAAQDRHRRHEGSLSELGTRVGAMEDQVSTNTEWIFGPEGASHRGAEQRLTDVETRLSQGKLVFLQYVLPAMTTAVVSAAAVVIVTVLTRGPP